MKKVLFSMLSAFVLFACGNQKAANEPTTPGNDSAANNAPANLPYILKNTPDWVPGDPAHVAPAMHALRSFELNDMVGLRKHLADSVEFYTNNFKFKGSGDSLVKVLGGMRNELDSMRVTVHDYESVKSKSRGEEWVSLWYTQTVSPKGGTTDSSMVMDDIKIKNGKVASIDSKTRLLPKN